LRLRITIAGNTYEAEVEVLEDEETSSPYVPPPMPAYVPAFNPAPIGAVTTSDNDPSGRICRSPVTGLVIRVPVQPGQSVEAGQLLLVLEAMKMETQVTAPRSGTVQTIHVEPGNSVKVNQPLIELKWETSPAQGSLK
jgi:methylmalonyl-CoA carboxyltransferase small subunit